MHLGKPICYARQAVAEQKQQLIGSGLGLRSKVLAGRISHCVSETGGDFMGGMTRPAVRVCRQTVRRRGVNSQSAAPGAGLARSQSVA